MNNIINILALKIIWLLAVIGAANGIIWPSLLGVLCFAFWQLSPSRKHRNDMLFVCLAIPIGFCLDSLWQTVALIDFASGFNYAAPTWIIGLWASFALTFNHSLSWLKTRPLMAVLFGAFGAPISYYAAHKLGALTYPNGFVNACIYLSITWSLVILFFSQYEKLSLLRLKAQSSK